MVVPLRNRLLEPVAFTARPIEFRPFLVPALAVAARATMKPTVLPMLFNHGERHAKRNAAGYAKANLTRHATDADNFSHQNGTTL